MFDWIRNINERKFIKILLTCPTYSKFGTVGLSDEDTQLQRCTMNDANVALKFL